MNTFHDTDEEAAITAGESDGQNTMAVLNTLGGGGGDDVLPEGEALGLDPDAGKAKLSGSSLAVGVVVVLGALSLLGMKLTLGAISGGSDPTDAEAAIAVFLTNHETAQKVGVDGPIKAPDSESQRVLEELKQDPTKNQVPPEEVETNPFDISEIVKKPEVNPDGGDGPTTPPADERERAVIIAKAAAAKLTIDGIAGDRVFINGEQYQVGNKIAGGKFVLDSVDGLTCIIKTTDKHGIRLRLRYR